MGGLAGRVRTFLHAQLDRESEVGALAGPHRTNVLDVDAAAVIATRDRAAPVPTIEGQVERVARGEFVEIEPEGTFAPAEKPLRDEVGVDVTAMGDDQDA